LGFTEEPPASHIFLKSERVLSWSDTKERPITPVRVAGKTLETALI
jgi:hypothetical protein